MAFYQIEPFGEERADLRAAMLAALIANIYRDEGKRSKPFTASDFMLNFDEPPAPTEDGWRAQKAAFSALQSAQQKKRKATKK